MARKSKNIQDDTKLLSYEQISVMLSCSVSQVFALRERGRLPIKPIRIGGMVRFPRRQVEKWIDAGCPVDFRGGGR